MFAAVGLLYLIGTATFVIFVGFVVLLVAEILQVVAFLSLGEGSENPRPGSEADK